ncbi:helix-turn-helix transcriptional regulator [uncultured Arcticibacterium sp.]|uniref:AraC family transcriptional regulator n=1 Tax=uncultured Arcticibacterium sp. TaxID=2173042 RepID=UPI0030F4CF78
MYTFHYFNKEPILSSEEDSALTCNLLTDCDIFKIEVSSESMDGSFTYSKTADNIYYLFMDLQVHEDVNICFKGDASRKGMCLFYNIGDCLSLQILDKKHALSSENLYIGMSKSSDNLNFAISENTGVKLILIQTDFVELVEENFCVNASLPTNISKAKGGFYDKFVQKKALNGQMRGLINKCLTNSQEGLERKMNLEAHCKELTALAIGTIGKYKTTYDNTAAVLTNKEREAIHAVAKILEEKYSNPPLQTELAREVGLNLNKMTSGFKLIYGQTINKYLLKVRMSKAKSLLVIDNDFTVGEVAEAVGFSHASYFIKKFKESYGETPGVFV